MSFKIGFFEINKSNNCNSNSRRGAAAAAAATVLKKLVKWIFFAGTEIDPSYVHRTKIFLNLLVRFYAMILTWIGSDTDYKSVALPIELWGRCGFFNSKSK